jgi:hypothetical protein
MGCSMLHVLYPVERRARQWVEYVPWIPARDANLTDRDNLRVARCETESETRKVSEVPDHDGKGVNLVKEVALLRSMCRASR